MKNKTMSEYDDVERVLLKEELTSKDLAVIKDMIQKQLIRLFYQLYVKKTFWST